MGPLLPRLQSRQARVLRRQQQRQQRRQIRDLLHIGDSVEVLDGQGRQCVRVRIRVWSLILTIHNVCERAIVHAIGYFVLTNFKVTSLLG